VVDGSLKIDNGVELTALQPSHCQLGKNAFDGIESGTGRWRKVKGEVGMEVEQSWLGISEEVLW